MQAWRDLCSSHTDVLAAPAATLYLGGGYKVLGGDRNEYHLSNGCASLCARLCVNNLLLNGTKSRKKRFKGLRCKMVAGHGRPVCILYAQWAGATEFMVECLSSWCLQSNFYWNPKRQSWRARPLGHNSLNAAPASAQCHLTQERTAETNISKFLLFSSNFHSFPLLTSTKLMLWIYTQSSGLWIHLFLLNFSEILEYSERWLCFHNRICHGQSLARNHLSSCRWFSVGNQL